MSQWVGECVVFDIDKSILLWHGQNYVRVVDYVKNGWKEYHERKE